MLRSAMVALLVSGVTISDGTAAEPEEPKPSSGAKATLGAGPGQWVDVLKLVDLKKRGVAGKWQRRERELVVSAVQNPARLPICPGPRGAYDVKLEFTRTDGDGIVGVILPVGPRQFLVAVNYGGGASGIDMIDGRRANQNDSSVPGALTNDRRFTLEIVVRPDQDEASITTVLDGRPFVFYRGPASSLALHKEWSIGSKSAIGLVANADVVFHRLDVKANRAGQAGE